MRDSAVTHAPGLIFLGVLLVAIGILWSGSVVSAQQTTIAGGTWQFRSGSTDNVVQIVATGLPAAGFGAADINIAFDSAVLRIIACDTGDLDGACNPNVPGGPARAAGFKAPAIDTEPAVIATLTFDCVGAADTSSALTITVNDLFDGTPGDPQPMSATVQNGTVVCRADTGDCDCDGRGDATDNCPATSNSDQIKTDADLAAAGATIGGVADTVPDNGRDSVEEADVISGIVFEPGDGARRADGGVETTDANGVATAGLAVSSEPGNIIIETLSGEKTSQATVAVQSEAQPVQAGGPASSGGSFPGRSDSVPTRQIALLAIGAAVLATGLTIMIRCYKKA